jgi:flagellar biogenesis protein FliO
VSSYGIQDLLVWIAFAIAVVYVVSRFRKRKPKPKNVPDVPASRLVRKR